jgi:hypothetical protein
MKHPTNEILQDLLLSIRHDIDCANLTGPARTPEEFDNNRDACLSLVSEYREALALRQRDKVYPILDSYLREKGIKLDPEDYQEMAGRLLQAMPDLLEYEADWHLQGTPPPPPPPVPEVVSVLPASSFSLQAAMDDYWKETAPTWKARTVTDYEVYRGRLLEFVGPDALLDTIDHARMRGYKDGLVKSGLSVSRVNGHLTFAGAVFRFAKRHRMMTADNPTEGLKLKTITRADEQREAFTEDDLVRLFQTIPKNSKHPHQKWLPLLGLFTGARLEELCQLYRV